MLANLPTVKPLRLFACAAWAAFVAMAISSPPVSAAEPGSASKPNILWITCEDMGPHLGCFGDAYAESPRIDQFSRRSLRYTRVWSNAPVCAPARTTLITGIYPPATGSEHMRSHARLPAGMKFFPQYLRSAGYYCTNNSKEDYNLVKPGDVWDESSNKAHYRNRKEGQPFFAVFNFTITHESQIRKRPHELKHDPAGARLPKYHPDTPETRHDWAQYYDNITVMDKQAGQLLDELEKEGLAKNTIVFFYSDHGSGMPRNKRWPFNSGNHVPLIVHFPEGLKSLAPSNYQPGGVSERLVSFVDFGPTALSLAGVAPPDVMQGKAFLGSHATPPRDYLHGFRGRMDERYDMVRSVRDARYVYVRNYLPHLIYGQHLDYMFQTPTTVAWKTLFDEGRLNDEQAAFWKAKPAEELYDLTRDPDEVHNLASNPQFKDVLLRMRAEQGRHALEIRDVGFLSEDEIHVRSEGRTPYELGHDPKFPLERIIETANLASSLSSDATGELEKRIADEDAGVRYWAALGLRMRGASVVADHRTALRKSLEDPSPSVRIVAAEALARFGDDKDRSAAIDTLMKYVSCDDGTVYLALASLNALDGLEILPSSVREKLRDIPLSKARPAYGIERLKNSLTRNKNDAKSK